ncbi:MAG TPA: 30S ribosome-binding factor RbfA [Arcobacter sp.]|nr:30S ribosome-binding factor RbfA [Arcobacter sp.]
MNNKSVNLQRTESLLKELIPEALAELSDFRINSLTITEVDCKNGKYDARVFFDASDLDAAELREARQLLRKASSRIRSYCLNATGWYKCPNFEFVKDDMVAKNLRMEDLFAQIASKKTTNNEEE